MLFDDIPCAISSPDDAARPACGRPSARAGGRAGPRPARAAAATSSGGRWCPGMFGRRVLADGVVQGGRQQQGRRLGEQPVRPLDRLARPVRRPAAPAGGRAATSGPRSSSSSVPVPCSRCSSTSVAGPQPGDRRQVVRGDRGHRLGRPLGGVVVLEPEQPVGQDRRARPWPRGRRPRPCRGPRRRRAPARGGSPARRCRAGPRPGSGRRRRRRPSRRPAPTTAGTAP